MKNVKKSYKRGWSVEMNVKIIFTTVIMTLVISTTAFAHGIGVRGGYGLFLPSANDTDRPAHVGYIGLVYDTNLSSSRIFNMRFNIDLALVKSDNTGVYSVPGDYLISVRTIYGFGLVRTKAVRLFVGPEVGFEIFSRNNMWSSPIDVTVGAVVGLNINIGRFLTLSLDAGYKLGLMEVIYRTSSLPIRHDVFAGLSVMFRFNEYSSFK
jgi:hypothetical protein